MSIKRIQKELQDIVKDPDDSFSFSAKDMDVYHLEGVILGPDDSPYKNGIFLIDVRLPLDYPFKMPKFLFTTKIYHPNINEKGVVCLDLHKGYEWSPALTIRKAFVSLVSLLSNPNPEDPLMPEIAKIYKKDRAQFEKTAKEWTEKYAT